MYTIKEVSEKTGVSEHTLRFWAKSGFFPFVKRFSGGITYGFFGFSSVFLISWRTEASASSFSFASIFRFFLIISSASVSMTFPVAVTTRFLSMTVSGSPGAKDSSSTLTAVSSFVCVQPLRVQVNVAVAEV